MLLMRPACLQMNRMAFKHYRLYSCGSCHMSQSELYTSIYQFVVKLMTSESLNLSRHIERYSKKKPISNNKIKTYKSVKLVHRYKILTFTQLLTEPMTWSSAIVLTPEVPSFIRPHIDQYEILRTSSMLHVRPDPGHDQSKSHFSTGCCETR